MHVDSNTFILLQTALGEVSSEYQPHTDLTNHVWLWKSAELHNKTEQETSFMLYLSAMRTEKLRINTFWCGNEQLKDCDAVELCLKDLA